MDDGAVDLGGEGVDLRREGGDLTGQVGVLGESIEGRGGEVFSVLDVGLGPGAVAIGLSRLREQTIGAA